MPDPYGIAPVSLQRDENETDSPALAGESVNLRIAVLVSNLYS
jgi:hypothetical protein